MSADPAHRHLHDELIAAGLLTSTGVPGLYGRLSTFESILLALDAYLSAELESDPAEFMRFPPVIPRAIIERSGYLKSFPHLAGTVFSFSEDEKRHQQLLGHVERGEDWSSLQTMTDAALVPAACYPVYPYVASQGRLPEGGRTIDVASYCFRHEPSDDPGRMQSFRMHEHVRVAEPEVVAAWREEWIPAGQRILGRLGLDTPAEPASDPFFGRGGRMLAANQRDEGLKFELVHPIASRDRPAAIMSINYHEGHFAEIFGIETSTGEAAHTACLGFGLERVTLALFVEHGYEPDGWPGEVRQLLGLESR